MALSTADSSRQAQLLAPQAGGPSALGHGLSTAMQTLLLTSILSHPRSTEALWPSSISANGWTWNWYMAITPFEAVFLNFIMLEIAILRYVEILPININNLFYGDPSGRRRRKRKVTSGTLCGGSGKSKLGQEAVVLDSMFAVMQKLDRQECLQRTLCQIEAARTCGTSTPTPKAMQQILALLKALRLPQGTTDASCVPHLVEVLESAQRAVQVGSDEGRSQNATAILTCEKAYSLCPINPNDTEFYLARLYSLDD